MSFPRRLAGNRESVNGGRGMAWPCGQSDRRLGMVVEMRYPIFLSAGLGDYYYYHYTELSAADMIGSRT